MLKYVTRQRSNSMSSEQTHELIERPYRCVFDPRASVTRAIEKRAKAIVETHATLPLPRSEANDIVRTFGPKPGKSGSPTEGRVDRDHLDATSRTSLPQPE